MTASVNAVARSVHAGVVRSGGEDIHVMVTTPVSVPEPRTVVLGHGAGGSHLVFFQQIEALSRTHRVVAWDQRGFGASTARTGRTGPIAAAEDLLAILDSIGDPHPAHLVGQSMSGWTAVRAALDAPQRVASLVLSGSIGGMFSNATRASLDRFIAAAAASSGRPAAAGVCAALAPSFPARSGSSALLYQLIGLLPGPGVDAVRRIRDTEFAVADVASLGLPVLFVAGQHDEIFPAAEIEQLATAIPTASVVVADTGHSPYFEDPVTFNSAVARFVAEVEAGRPGAG